MAVLGQFDTGILKKMVYFPEEFVKNSCIRAMQALF
jgi:hypothetical protein